MNTEKRLLKKIEQDPELLGIYEAEIATDSVPPASPAFTVSLRQDCYEFEFNRVAGAVLDATDKLHKYKN